VSSRGKGVRLLIPCIAVSCLIAAFVHGALPPALMRACEEHLESGCQDCRHDRTSYEGELRDGLLLAGD
jgi:hypothetical protein